VEEELAKLLGGEDLLAVVTSVPDTKKGERLAVVHLPMDQTPEQLNQGLAAAGLPNLFIPSRDAYVQVDEIPVLGTGKLDLKAIQQLALEPLG
jgi:acyl-[acyl-carrier-protein]-phospholipid O-acyltransferase/long-chain-fatty-acid--[acyl-carrier-protein] ligase